MRRSRSSPDPRKQRIYNAIEAIDCKFPGRDALMNYLKTMDMKQGDLCAMSQQKDPFFRGTESDIADAQWAKNIYDSLESQDIKPERKHLRRIHYLFGSLPLDLRKQFPVRRDAQSYDIYNPQHWPYLQHAFRMARLLGYLHPACFIEKYSQLPVWLAPEGSTIIEDEYSWALLNGDRSWAEEEFDGWEVPTITFDDQLVVHPPRLHFDVYNYEPRYQPYRLAVIIEKSGNEEDLIPVCQKYNADFWSGKGFASHTRLYEMIERVGQFYQNTPTLIFYISDYDSRGESMPKAAARALQFYTARDYPEANIKLHPIALTRQQYEEVYLLEDGSSMPTAEDRIQVELDALDAFFPGELAWIAESWLKRFTDNNLESNFQKARAEAKDVMRSAWKEATKEEHEELEKLQSEINEVTEKFRLEVEELNDEMQEELAPLQERLDEISQRLKQKAEDLDPALPPVPEPAEIEDDVDWFFDSSRTYREQMSYYKEYKEQSIKELEKEPDDEEQE